MVGAILAGGRASRFGGAPKGLACVGGVRMLDRVADALRGACDELLVVSDAPDAAGWLPDARVVRDVLAGRGSLGGLHGALAHAGGLVVVVAWDMPFVTASLVRALRDEGMHGAAAVVPVGPHGAEPLCAYYGPVCLDAAARLLGAGERRARALGEAVATTWLDAARLAAHGDPETLLLSVNTPYDLARAERLAAG